MDNPDKVTEIPDFDEIYKRIRDDAKPIPMNVVADIVYDVVKHSVHDSRKEFCLGETESNCLGMTLISSIFMSLLSFGCSDDEIVELAKACNVDVKHYEGFKERKFDA